MCVASDVECIGLDIFICIICDAHTVEYWANISLLCMLLQKLFMWKVLGRLAFLFFFCFC